MKRTRVIQTKSTQMYRNLDKFRLTRFSDCLVETVNEDNNTWIQKRYCLTHSGNQEWKPMARTNSHSRNSNGRSSAPDRRKVVIIVLFMILKKLILLLFDKKVKCKPREIDEKVPNFLMSTLMPPLIFFSLNVLKLFRP